MLDTFLRWLGAGDAAIASMGPVLSIALALLGGYGITQFVKFPLSQFITERWLPWTIRSIAVPATWVCAHYLGNLPPMLELVVSFSTPLAYTVTMNVVRRFWPWLEAGKVAGSVYPSDEAILARRDRQG